jgi:hypothetical protein
MPVLRGHCKRKIPSKSTHSMIAQRDPIIAIELEEPPLDKEKEEATSPIQQFRNNGILSVSDLVSPFWFNTTTDYDRDDHGQLKSDQNLSFLPQGKKYPLQSLSPLKMT